MRWLRDTNVLLRLADTESPEHGIALASIESLIAEDNTVFITTQVLVEFWAVATRPESVNGLGWSAGATGEVIQTIRAQFPVLAETPELLDRWLHLVRRFDVSGKHTHDARLAALLLVNGVHRILTFNTADFPPGWGIEAVPPSL
jgi:predicted nucleic acid-binding protein